MSLLEIEGLRVAYGDRAPAVDGVDLTVEAGEVVALVGESGSGKSTTAHAIVGLLPRGGRVIGGSIRFNGRDLLKVGDRELRSVRGREIGLVPQDPMIALNPVQKVGRQVAEVLKIHGLARGRAADARAVELLADAGLGDPDVRARQYPHQLSGGMRQRALIALALACGPKLVIADEPTSALDVTVQKRILDHLETLIARTGTAVLLITHDLGVAADRAQRIVVAADGRVVEAGPAAEVLRAPREPYTRALLASAPSLSAGRLRASAVSTVADASDALVVATGLEKDYKLPRSRSGPRVLRAVDDVSFTIPRGETFALVGESGSGKSTVARLVLRLTTATAGTVTFDGVDATRLRGEALRRLRRRMQPVYQNPYASLSPRLTVEEAIAEPLHVFRVGDAASRRGRAAALVDQVALPAGMLARKPAELSGGQRQRVAIARALALEPELVVCDEPVSALDVSVQRQILDLLVRLQGELGLSYLFISHDLAVVSQIADRVGVMRDGRLVESGPAETLLTNPQHEYTKELLAAIPGSRTPDPVR
ncbi:dipeptide ABC transporter ATP-binding protein [Cryptosporangium aurantiacum]|uniref:Peptide/nickel transport system ATP-binding protein n=1 Tax=Cryptosporangium aurantiacum TaxID=134849 RepID=A0A1M7QAV6_9ACTN|nr:ABC transporter ATP-binding protein [Cryptosporangium aurantiacum]SHN27849.1 peptide/nickel transport system ATP-binding protein [Cryptosporangium aurantiacum]